MNMHDTAPGVAGLKPADVEQRFWSMHDKSRSEAPSSEAERRDLLSKLRRVISTSTPTFVDAISQDFGHRSPSETLLAEVLPSLLMVGSALANLKSWMRPEKRGTSLLFWPARNEVHRQPKGVVLIISPWNYPLQLTVGPLAAALAAGNRVIIKPSELTPATSALLKQRLEEALGADRVTVALGGPEVAEDLCRLPFDHILFTGSIAVGRKVMSAAAQNLVPVTLELGGKSPAIVHADCNLPSAVERIVRGKLLNAGQTCIAPDYALVPRGKVEEFLRLFREVDSPLLSPHPQQSRLHGHHQQPPLRAARAPGRGCPGQWCAYRIGRSGGRAGRRHRLTTDAQDRANRHCHRDRCDGRDAR